MSAPPGPYPDFRLNLPNVVKKSKWTEEEDRQLAESVSMHGMGNWTLVAQLIPGRNGKQCRERWIHQICPSLNKENWTPREDAILIQQQRLHGNSWAKIAQFLPGRSSNNIKNRWSWLSRHHYGVPFLVQGQFQVAQPHLIPNTPDLIQAAIPCGGPIRPDAIAGFAGARPPPPDAPPSVPEKESGVLIFFPTESPEALAFNPPERAAPIPRRPTDDAIRRRDP
jgi:hypothetical protein